MYKLSSALSAIEHNGIIEKRFTEVSYNTV